MFNTDENNITSYPKNFGHQWRSDAFARIHGPCGDTVCIWLKIDRNRIYKATFTSDGCLQSIACCSTAAKLIEGKTIEEALAITPEEILAKTGPVPEDHQHCALLAANTIKKAISIYQEKVPKKTFHQRCSHLFKLIRSNDDK